MPELPEVETTRRGIEPHLQGLRIQHIIIRQCSLRWLVPEALLQALSGKSISAVTRRGKYLLIAVADQTILIHLGMSGTLRIATHADPIQKHDHVDIVLENKKILRYKDPRRFGAVLLISGDPNQHALLKHLGPEPLSSAFNKTYLHQTAKTRAVSIKTFIMDHKVVTGVGNIYATEALFLARIHPKTPANRLTIQQMDQLAKAIKITLRQAIKKGGTTLKDFLNSEGKPGYFVNHLQVYGREGKPCFACKTIVQAVRIGQRNSFYCRKCQKS